MAGRAPAPTSEARPWTERLWTSEEADSVAVGLLAAQARDAQTYKGLHMH